VGFAERVRRATHDGKMILDFMIAVAQGATINGRKPRLCDRMEANKWLADRGWGKPVQSMEHLGPGGPPMSSEGVFYLPLNLRDHGSATKEIGADLDPIVPE